MFYPADFHYNQYSNENKSHLRLDTGATMTLADLKPGQSARIESIDTTIPGVVRLMVLGLIEDAIVRIENAAIGGDPIEISLFGTSVSVRRQHAAHFRIAPVVSNG
jgi:Fe2+ transport system protein FeoA